MSDDYFSYLQSQLAVLQDESPAVVEDPPPARPAASSARPLVTTAPPVPSAPPPRPKASTPVSPVAPPHAPIASTPVAPVPPVRPTQAPLPSSPVAPLASPSTFAQPHPPLAAPQLAAPSFAAPSYAILPVASPSRRGRWIAAALVLALVVSASAVFGATRLLSRQPSYPKQWDPRVADIVQFVEHERGLTFKHPVPVDFMAPAAFKAKMGGGKVSASDARELEHTVAQARALGLLHGKVDLGQLDKQMVEEEVIGLYEPTARRVFVRGDNLTPAVRVTLAHELTHALQDQYFNLQRRPDPAADDNAERALVEGDAMRVEQAFTEQLSDADRAAYEKEDSQGAQQADVKGLPEALTASFAFPYVYGPAFVQALFDDGGNAAVDAALRQPPKTDAEVIDPQRYLDGVHPAFPKPATLQPGDSRLEKPSAFGEFGALEVLGDRVGFVRAWQALVGWRGDSIVPFSRSHRDCVALVTRFDDVNHAANFAAVANEWVEGATNGVVLQQGTAVQLEACDPGPDAASSPPATPSAIEVLEVRSAVVTLAAKQKGVDRQLATCATDGAIARLGAQAFVDAARSDTLSGPARQAFAEAGAACRAAGG